MDHDRVTVAMTDACVIVTMHGKFSDIRDGSVLAAIATQMGRGKDLVIDLAPCLYVSSSVLSWFVQVYDVAVAHGRTATMVGASRHLANQCAMVGLDTMYIMMPHAAR